MSGGPISIGPSTDGIHSALGVTLGGTYRLIHEISRGGMGVVYRAEDLSLERPVAIKMLRPDLGEDRAFVEHLRVEAAMLARLEHPNLVRIYNFGQSGGDSYFVMELVEGEALQQALERYRREQTTMAIGEPLSVIEQIASALDTLHERGIVHRDVNPANVIRDPFNGRSVLVDVGIARRYGELAQTAGTPGYISPEVTSGGEATPRSDVFGLAATAFTMLTLAAPWSGSDLFAVLAHQSSQPPPLPSSLRAELAPADAVLLGALELDPAKRPASAGAFARALSRALSGIASKPAHDTPRRIRETIRPPQLTAANAKTRGVVFRSVTRALGIRDAERLRDALGQGHSALACALTDTAPLAWLPTEMFIELLSIAPPHVGRGSEELARDIARATVRASFRRFFPASASTLVVERTLSAVRSVWSRYQSWGVVSSMPVHATETMVQITDTPRVAVLCDWTVGMLGQLVTLSGGKDPEVEHHACEAKGDAALVPRAMGARGSAQNNVVAINASSAAGSSSSPFDLDRKPSASHSRARISSRSLGSAENSTTGTSAVS